MSEGISDDASTGSSHAINPTCYEMQYQCSPSTLWSSIYHQVETETWILKKTSNHVNKVKIFLVT